MSCRPASALPLSPAPRPRHPRRGDPPRPRRLDQRTRRSGAGSSEDAIKPWTHRSWIFPRDPDFAPKAARVLDLYAGEWDGRAAQAPTSSSSAPTRRRASRPGSAATGRSPRPRATRCSSSTSTSAAGHSQYLAAWDVHRAKLFGRCEPTTGIEPFDRLVDQVMTAEPYRSARRVFWVLDNGSSHRGRAAVRRLVEAHPRLVPVHSRSTPVGSTRSRSTSASSSARSSPRPTPPRSRSSPPGSSPSRPATRSSPNRSNGSSREPISPGCSNAWR